MISIEDDINTLNNPEFYLIFDKLFYSETAVKTKLAQAANDRKGKEIREVGRPKISKETISKIISLHENQHNFREIAKKCNVSVGSVYKYIKKAERDKYQKMTLSNST